MVTGLPQVGATGKLLRGPCDMLEGCGDHCGTRTRARLIFSPDVARRLRPVGRPPWATFRRWRPRRFRLSARGRVRPSPGAEAG